MPVNQLVRHPLKFRRTTRNHEPPACLSKRQTEIEKEPCCVSHTLKGNSATKMASWYDRIVSCYKTKILKHEGPGTQDCTYCAKDSYLPCRYVVTLAYKDLYDNVGTANLGKPKFFKIYVADMACFCSGLQGTGAYLSMQEAKPRKQSGQVASLSQG